MKHWTQTRYQTIFSNWSNNYNGISKRRLNEIAKEIRKQSDSAIQIATAIGPYLQQLDEDGQINTHILVMWNNDGKKTLEKIHIDELANRFNEVLHGADLVPHEPYKISIN